MKILFLRSSAFATPRLSNQAIVLSMNGAKVSIMHWERGIVTEYNHTKELELLTKYGIESIPIFVGRASYNKGILSIFKRFRYWMNIVMHLRSVEYDYIHAIDFDSALPVYFAKLCFRLKFKYNYDIADYIQTFKSFIPSFVRRIVDVIDNQIIKHSNAIVLPDINRLFRIPLIYRYKVIIVNNAPFLSHAEIIENKDLVVNVDDAKINLFYYGAFSDERGIAELINCIPNFRNIHFYFAGVGLLESEIRKVSDSFPNSTYFGRLSYSNCLYLLSLMDISYVCYNPRYEHNRVAAPNKLYEALFYNKPVIVANNTSIDIVVNDNNLGYCIDYSIESLSDLLNRLRKEDLVEFGNNPHIVEGYSYDFSKKNLLNMYFNY